jgi:uncharacterized membrane protein YoaK (UPF0700 family)
MTRYDRRAIALAIALSSLAGYVDANGFLSAGGVFVSFMSGNSTRLGIAVARGHWDFVTLSVEVVGLFVLGVIVGAILARRMGRLRKPAVLILVAVLLTAAAIAQAFHQSRLTLGLLLLAMGAENAVFQRGGEVSIGLTYVTGALVRVGQRIAAIADGGPCWAWTPFALLWLGLIAGASSGAYIHNEFPLVGLWPAVGFSVVLAGLAFRIRPQFD